MCKRTKQTKSLVFLNSDDLVMDKSCLNPGGGTYEIVSVERVYSEQISELLSGSGLTCNHQLTAGDAPASVLTGPLPVECGDTLHFWSESINFSVGGTAVNAEIAVSSDLGNLLEIGGDGKLYAGETLTTLTLNGANLEYNDEEGVTTVIPIPSGVSTDVGNDLVLGMDGLPYFSETVTTLALNGTNLEYSDEEGVTTVIPIPSGVSTDVGNDLVLGMDGLPYFSETVTTVVPSVTGHAIATYNNEGGAAVIIEETVTSLVDNGDSTATYTSESGAITVISTVPDANRPWGSSDTQRTNSDSVTTSDNIFHTGQVSIGTNNSGHNAGSTLTVLGTVSFGLANHTLAGSANLVNGSLNTVNASQGIVTGLSNNAAGGRFLVAGTTNVITGTFDSVIAGAQNTVTSSTRSLIAGEQNTVTSMARGLLVGDLNNVSGGTRSMIAGISNTVGSASQQIVAGSTNTINGAGDGLLVGNLNVVDPTNAGFGTNSIVGGLSNTLGTNRSFMIGQGNTATGNTGVNSITFGLSNTAAAVSSLVGGYSNSLDSTSQNVILSGSNNTVTAALHSLIVGEQNVVSGQDVLVSGQLSNQTHDYGVMFGGSGTALIASTADAEMTARMAGGFRFFTDNALTSGVTLAPSASAWVAVSDSATKTGFESVELSTIAQKFRDLDVKSYQIRGDATMARHIGVMADKFNELFGDIITPKKVGKYNGLSHQDVDGVLMAMIHYLLGRIDTLEAKLVAA